MMKVPPPTPWMFPLQILPPTSDVQPPFTYLVGIGTLIMMLSPPPPPIRPTLFPYKRRAVNEYFQEDVFVPCNSSKSVAGYGIQFIGILKTYLWGQVI